MWLWVIIALASLTILTILVLCMPLDLVFQVNTSESPMFRGRLLWLFGLVDWELKKTGGKPEKKQKPAETRRKRGRKISASTIFQILRTRGLFTQLRRLVVDILRSLKIKKLAANIKLGLENPADTAILFAVTGPFSFLCSLLPYQISVLPSFDGDIIFEAHLHSTTRLLPILLVLALLKFVFSLPALRVARTLVRKR
jgi:hypothetical protein